MTRFWLFIVICGLVFSGLSTMLAPRYLAWYANPPVDIGVSCNTAIEWGMRTLVSIQIGGLVFGATLGAILFFWIRGKRTPPAAAPASIPPGNP